MEKAFVREVHDQCPPERRGALLQAMEWTSGGWKRDGHEWGQFPRLVGLAEMAAQ
jgi:hypothetical protein